ncbi:MAG: phosphoribosylaminoimidazolesuccinocarboxamide synthase [Bacteroidales bacterium]|nr:phosphoribosylaminoimidazolesuccinocarboxamide synthase [Bacteroidales bacterium]
MERNELIFNGNVKQVYSTDEPDKVIIRYKDVATAFSDIKRATVKSKGIYNNRISAILFTELERCGVSTHYVGMLSDREQICRKLEVIPLMVILRNRIAGSQARRLGLEEGTRPVRPFIDLFYINEKISNPFLNDDHAVSLGIASYDELDLIRKTALHAGTILTDYLAKAGIELIDAKLRFGKGPDGSLVLIDEIDPDTCRLWDIKTGEKLDKDRFRYDLSGVNAAYKEVCERLSALPGNENII